ncbi:hypothetical protein EV363DRAFT_1453946 [Boletus edulis]|nr:hypothetical protein EV363DRAFT_1453946 [Boletus edulis]
MACNQGEADQHGVGIVVETNNSARQDYVIRATSNVGSIGLVYSLVCPYPVGQTNLDWSTFIESIKFLQSTTCEIIPKLTTLVTYDHGILNATIVNSTVLSSQNANLALFFGCRHQLSIEQPPKFGGKFDRRRPLLNSVTTTTSLSHGGPLDRRLLEELEQYWRGVIEFSGTYRRSGFFASPIKSRLMACRPIYRCYYGVVQALADIPLYCPSCNAFRPVHLRCNRLQSMAERKRGHKFATFGSTDPIHLIMVSSMREPGGKEAWNLEGETLGGFDVFGIQENEDLWSSSPMWIVLTSDCASVL